MKPKQPKPRTMIPAKVRAKLAQAAKPQSIVTATRYEATQSGNLVHMFTVQCHACGGTIHTPVKGTIFHPDCSFSIRMPLSTKKCRERLSKMRPQEKDRLLIQLMKDVHQYQNHFGLLVDKNHIKSSDSLIRAMKDKTRYAKLNAIAGEWLAGE